MVIVMLGALVSLKNPRIGFEKKKRRKNLNPNYYFTKSDQHGSWFNSYSNSTNIKKTRESHFTCSQTFIFLFNHCPMHEQNKSRKWEKINVMVRGSCSFPSHAILTKKIGCGWVILVSQIWLTSWRKGGECNCILGKTGLELILNSSLSLKS